MYQCIKNFSVPRCDDDGFMLENEEMIIEAGSLWDISHDEDYRLIDGDIRLESYKDTWIEINVDTFNECFIKINE